MWENDTIAAMVIAISVTMYQLKMGKNMQTKKKQTKVLMSETASKHINCIPLKAFQLQKHMKVIHDAQAFPRVGSR